eukprot:4099519-Ditylum_brightwellii.AAC.2
MSAVCWGQVLLHLAHHTISGGELACAYTNSFALGSTPSYQTTVSRSFICPPVLAVCFLLVFLESASGSSNSLSSYKISGVALFCPSDLALGGLTVKVVA